MATAEPRRRPLSARLENSLPQQPFEKEAPSPAADKPQQPGWEEQQP